MKYFHRFFPLLLLIWHLFFAAVAYQYIIHNNGDANRYWFEGQELATSTWLDFLNPGTDVIKLFTFPLVKYFHLPLWSGFLLFSLISFAGWWVLYGTLQKSAGKNAGPKIWVVVLMLLPNLHFWTSNIGKEAVMMVPLAITVREIYRKRYFSGWLLCAILVMALIRPHVAFIFSLSYVLSLMFTQPLSAKFRMALAGGLLACTGLFAWILVNMQNFAGGVPRVIRVYEAHIRHFKKTDAYVPLDQYPLPYKLFTFYFRPLPFEKEGLFYAVISLENMLLLLLSAVAVYGGIRYFKHIKRDMLFVFPVVLMILFGIMYVYAYANYGIIMRTKAMVTPFLYLLLLVVLSASHSGLPSQKKGE